MNDVRVNNAIALAASMGLDVTEPVAAKKIERMLELVENKFGGDNHD